MSMTSLQDVLPGAIDVTNKLSGNSNLAWASKLPEHDIFVPCSKSSLIDVENAVAVPAKAICGSTNIPFASNDAEDAFTSRDGVFIPESITSAGAVIADSVEHFDLKRFKEAEPKPIYAFTRSIVYSKTMEALDVLKDKQVPIEEMVKLMSDKSSSQKPIGQLFSMELRHLSGRHLSLWTSWILIVSRSSCK